MIKEQLEKGKTLLQRIEAIEETLFESEKKFELRFSLKGMTEKIPDFLIDKQMTECANEIIKMGLIKNLEKYKKEFNEL